VRFDFLLTLCETRQLLGKAESFFAERGVVGAANNQMIQNIHIQKLAGFHDLPSHQDIFIIYMENPVSYTGGLFSL